MLVSLIKEKKWKLVLLQNLLPLILAYFVSVILFTYYLVNLGESSFELKHIFQTSYPYTANTELIGLYLIGFFTAFITMPNILKILKITTLICVLSLVGIWGYKFIVQTDQLAGVQVLENKYQSIEEIITQDQFKDKIVYIDLWFSSCGPCIDQMKNHLPKLKNELAQSNLNVAYLYLGKETSGPLSKERWWKVIKKQNLKGHHLYIENSEIKSFWATILPVLKEKGVRPYSYPHYLIAIQGKIVDYDAPYPEEFEKVKEIMTKKFAGL